MIPRLSTFILPSPVWPLPICLDSWTWHSRFLCNIALYSIGSCFYHQSHPQLGIVFSLAPSLHSSGVISPLISSSIFDTYWPEEFIFECPIFLPFHTVHGVLKARILKWLAIPFSSGPCSVRPLHHDPPILGCPAGMAWFHWVRQGCGPSVIRLTSFLWVWFQCVCPLMPSCNNYHLTWFSLTLAWGISSWLLQQSTAAVPYLGWGVSPYCRRSWPSMWDSSSLISINFIYLSFSLTLTIGFLRTWRVFIHAWLC